MLGQIITVTVDRPLGSTHPKHKILFTQLIMVISKIY